MEGQLAIPVCNHGCCWCCVEQLLHSRLMARSCNHVQRQLATRACFHGCSWGCLQQQLNHRCMPLHGCQVQRQHAAILFFLQGCCRRCVEEQLDYLGMPLGCSDMQRQLAVDPRLHLQFNIRLRHQQPHYWWQPQVRRSMQQRVAFDRVLAGQVRSASLQLLHQLIKAHGG